MDMASQIPDDPDECRRLLADLLRSNDALRSQVEAEHQGAEEGHRRIGELERVLDQTAADYDRLRQEPAALDETLPLLRRYPFGPRRERRVDDPEQGYLFDLP